MRGPSQVVDLGCIFREIVKLAKVCIINKSNRAASTNLTVAVKALLIIGLVSWSFLASE